MGGLFLSLAPSLNLPWWARCLILVGMWGLAVIAILLSEWTAKLSWLIKIVSCALAALLVWALGSKTVRDQYREAYPVTVVTGSPLTRRTPIAAITGTKQYFPLPLSMRNLFDTDFQQYYGYGSEVEIPAQGGNGRVAIPVRMLMDFRTRAKFLAFLIPVSVNPVYACGWIVKSPKRVIELLDQRFAMTSILPGETASTTSTDLVFSGRVYVYYQSPLSLQELATLEMLFTENGLSVEFRGRDYQTLHWNEQREISRSQPVRRR